MEIQMEFWNLDFLEKLLTGKVGKLVESFFMHERAAVGGQTIAPRTQPELGFGPGQSWIENISNR